MVGGRHVVAELTWQTVAGRGRLYRSARTVKRVSYLVTAAATLEAFGVKFGLAVVRHDYRANERVGSRLGLLCLKPGLN